MKKKKWWLGVRGEDLEEHAEDLLVEDAGAVEEARDRIAVDGLGLLAGPAFEQPEAGLGHHAVAVAVDLHRHRVERRRGERAAQRRRHAGAKEAVRLHARRSELEPVCRHIWVQIKPCAVSCVSCAACRVRHVVCGRYCWPGDCGRRWRRCSRSSRPASAQSRPWCSSWAGSWCSPTRSHPRRSGVARYIACGVWRVACCVLRAHGCVRRDGGGDVT